MKIQKSIFFTLLSLAVLSITSCKEEKAHISYYEGAKINYDTLKPYFNTVTSNNYWRLGCTLNSMVDFLNISVQNDSITLKEAQTFLNNVAINYRKDGNWYDDWGWWGNTTAKVFDKDYQKLFKGNSSLKANFQNISKYCFNYMKTGDVSSNPLITGAPQAFNTAKRLESGIDSLEWRNVVNTIKPVWNNGCWQYYVDSNNYTSSLGSQQVTVVNGLYYILAQRVLAVGYSNQSDVDSMTNYFHNWMGKSQPTLTKEQQLFNVLDETPQAGLFRERNSIYANNTPVYDYDPNLAWTGDQGLMLSALTIKYQNNKKDKNTLKLMKAIIRGVFKYSVDSDNVIVPWSNQGQVQPGNAPGNDPGDYASGTGIFMRGLLQASSIPEIKELISEESIQLTFKNTAKLCLEDKYPYQGDVIFKQFNQLATLIAAHKLILREF